MGFAISGDNLKVKCPACLRIMLEGELNSEPRYDPWHDKEFDVYNCNYCGESFNPYEWDIIDAEA